MTDQPRTILSTLFTRDPSMPVWERHVDTLSLPEATAPAVLRVLWRARRYPVVILDGSGRRDQLAAMLLRVIRPRIRIVIADSTWKRESDWRGSLLNRVGIRLIDSPRTTFCVLSRFEVDSFPRTWGPLRSRIHFTPWPWTLKRSDFQTATSDAERVFAGGNSLRDYDLLIEAAGGVTAQIDLLTNTLNAEQLAACPDNVDARAVDQAEYDRLLYAASVVVVPLQARDDRSSGQTTFVNAMALGKAIVITDTPGVRDYIEDGDTGLIVSPGDPGALAAAIQRLVDDPALRRRIGDHAQRQALGHYSLTDYACHLLKAAGCETVAGPPA